MCLYLGMCIYESETVSLSVMSNSLWSHRLQPSRLLCPWNSPGKNIGMGCHSLLQGIFWAQRSNLGLLHCRQIVYHLGHRGAICLVLSKAIPFESFLQIRWYFTPRERVYNYHTVLSLGILDIKPVWSPYLNFTISLFSSFFIFPDLVFCQGSYIVLSVSLPFSVD